MSQYSFDEQTWQRSVEASERRRARAGERRRQQRKTAAVVVVALCALLAHILLVTPGRRRVGTPPELVVAWPQFQQPLKIAGDAANLALRPGRPVTITTAQPEKWAVQWSGEGVQTVDDRAVWDAVTDAPVLTVRCRPRVTGLARLTAWMRAPFAVTLHGYAPQRSADGLWTLAPVAGQSTPVWLAPQIGASLQTAAVWDERALPLLEAAAVAQPLPQPSRAPRWTIVPSFDGATGKRAAGDKATYAAISAADTRDGHFPDNFLKLAQFLSEEAPAASIKLIVKEPDTANAAGIVRLAFDGSGARAGWTKRAGEKSGQPFVWWK
jgi:hypothetical protein